MKRVISILNHKGGVAKTTSVASLGLGLAREGKRTLIIDLDAQANLTSTFIDLNKVETSIAEALVGKSALPIVEVAPNLYLVPSSLRLAGFSTQVANASNKERLLGIILGKVAEDYDYILIDCPPSLGLETTNALVASDSAYIPLVPELLPFYGLETIVEAVEEIGKATGKLRLGGIFFTLYESRRRIHREIEEGIVAKYGNKVLSTKIRKNVSLAEAPLYGGNIFEYAPQSNGAKDYESLAKEIIQREA